MSTFKIINKVHIWTDFLSSPEYVFGCMCVAFSGYPIRELMIPLLSCFNICWISQAAMFMTIM